MSFQLPCRILFLLTDYSITLPDDVFAPGEVKPTKPLKRKAPMTNGDLPMKKRGASDVGAEDRSTLVVNASRRK